MRGCNSSSSSSEQSALILSFGASCHHDMPTAWTCLLLCDLLQAPTRISQLPLQLLAQVLQHVDLGERLGSCAFVCSTWHAAAIAATRSVTVHPGGGHDVPIRFASLHAWLLKHGQAAAIGSLNVTGLGRVGKLQLPVPQLATLTKLQLGRPSVEFQQGPGSQQSSSAALPQELSALTHLELNNCPLSLMPCQHSHSCSICALQGSGDVL